MYSRLSVPLKKTINSASAVRPPTPFKKSGIGLLAVGLITIFGAKIVKNKYDEKKTERYGCHGRPKKYISYKEGTAVQKKKCP